MDATTVTAGLLHDVLEDTRTNGLGGGLSQPIVLRTDDGRTFVLAAKPQSLADLYFATTDCTGPAFVLQDENELFLQASVVGPRDTVYVQRGRSTRRWMYSVRSSNFDCLYLDFVPWRYDRFARATAEIDLKTAVRGDRGAAVPGVAGNRHSRRAHHGLGRPARLVPSADGKLGGDRNAAVRRLIHATVFDGRAHAAARVGAPPRCAGSARVSRARGSISRRRRRGCGTAG